MEENEVGQAPKRRVADYYAEDKPPPAAPPPEPEPLELKAEVPDVVAASGEDDVPHWAVPYMPPDFRIPRGKEVTFMRFKSAWTDARDKGVLTIFPHKVGQGEGACVIQREELYRVLVCWPITDAEEKLANKRGQQGSALNELAKQMIRAVDGRRVDWTGGWAREPEMLVNPEAVWKELGPKCRGPIKTIYHRMHNLTDEELATFLLNCLVVVNAVAG
jgi:hypothetical protein